MYVQISNIIYTILCAFTAIESTFRYIEFHNTRTENRQYNCRYSSLILRYSEISEVLYGELKKRKSFPFDVTKISKC